jgi:L-alanine-DL-glutamate epimerase-like enolase superfamily enzyme
VQIKKIEIIPLEVPYLAPISISVGTISKAKNLLIKVHTDAGVTGLGEVSPFIPAYSGETQEIAVKVLERWIGPYLIGKNPFNIEEIHQGMNQIISDHGCTKSGVDIALYDIMGKVLGVPVYQLLGGMCRERIPLWYAVSWDKGIGYMAEEASRRIEEGFTAIMVKIGRDLGTDIQSLKAVRKSIGEETPIIADPNQAYSRVEAVMLARQISNYIQALEGPVRRTDLEGLSAVKHLGLIEVIADESVSTPVEAMNLVIRDAADSLLIKPLRSGGLFPSKKIAAIAQAGGLNCYVASMTNLGVGHVANLHFTASTGNLTDRFGFGFENLLQIFGSPARSQSENISEVPEFTNGYYKVPHKPGLGIRLIERNVKKYALAGIEI